MVSQYSNAKVLLASAILWPNKNICVNLVLAYIFFYLKFLAVSFIHYNYKRKPGYMRSRLLSQLPIGFPLHLIKNLEIDLLGFGFWITLHLKFIYDAQRISKFIYFKEIIIIIKIILISVR